MLLDSNIIIYAAKPEYSALLAFIAKHAPAVSAISRVEVLGYHLLNPHDRRHFKDFFDVATILPISESVLSKAIELRQIRKMSLGTHSSAAPRWFMDKHWSPETLRISVGLMNCH